MREFTNICVPKFAFIRATPAISAPGSSRIEASVRILMISLVRCSVRTIRTSKELAIPSFASRAALRAVSTRSMSSVNSRLTPVGGDRIKLGVAERGEDFPLVGCEGAPQLPDPAAGLDELVVICSSGLLLGLARTL